MNHKETLFEHRFLTSNQDVGATYFNKMAATTSKTSVGNLWDSTNTRVVIPFKCFLDVWVNISTSRANEPSATSGVKIGAIGSLVTMFETTNTSSDGRVSGPTPYINRHAVDTAGHVAEPWLKNVDSDQTVTWYSGTSATQFAMSVTRRY